MRIRNLTKLSHAINVFNSSKTNLDYVTAYYYCEQSLQENDLSPSSIFLLQLFMLDSQRALGTLTINELNDHFKKLIISKPSSEDQFINEQIGNVIESLSKHISQLNSSFKEQIHYQQTFAISLNDVVNAIEKASSPFNETAKKLFSIQSLDQRVNRLLQALDGIEIATFSYSFKTRLSNDVSTAKAKLQEKLGDAYYDAYLLAKDTTQKINYLNKSLQSYFASCEATQSANKLISPQQHFSILNVYEKLAENDHENGLQHTDSLLNYIKKHDLKKFIATLTKDEREEFGSKLESHQRFYANYKKRKANQLQSPQTAPTITPPASTEFNIEKIANEFKQHHEEAMRAVKRMALAEPVLEKTPTYPKPASQQNTFALFSAPKLNSAEIISKAEEHFMHGLNLFVKCARPHQHILSNLFLAIAKVHEANVVGLNEKENRALQKALLEVSIALNPSNAYAKDKLNKCAASVDGRKPAEMIKACRREQAFAYFEKEKTKYIAHLRKTHPNLLSVILSKIAEELNSEKFLAQFKRDLAATSALSDIKRLLTQDHQAYRNATRKIF